MSEPARNETFQGSSEQISYRVWPNGQARHVVLIAHGYGEHIGRYEHVAALLVSRGAVVAGPDHLGHGRSGGARVVIEDYDAVVDDLHAVSDRVRADHRDLPVVLIGHSMGGTIAARYAQRFGSELSGLVLSGPVLAAWTGARDMLALEAIPETPLDPTTLSRDPRVGETYAADPLVWHGAFQRPLLEAWVRVLKDMDAAAPLGDLPTLWVHGEADKLVPLDTAREGIARLGAARLIERTYAGAEHEVFNETNQDEVLGTVADFIDEVTRDRPAPPA